MQHVRRPMCITGMPLNIVLQYTIVTILSQQSMSAPMSEITMTHPPPLSHLYNTPCVGIVSPYSTQAIYRALGIHYIHVYII